MTRVRYVGNAGRYKLTNGGVDVAQGETTTVDEDTAEYLLENGEFERVDEGDEAADDTDVKRVAPPLDPSEYTVSELEAALEEGDFVDEELAAIRAAEAAGQNRKGVRGAIDTRLEE